MVEDAMNARQGELASANARQHGGDHYKGSEYEHWDWVSECRLHYLAGCASKYVFRWRKKNGAEDLKKAHHYIDKAIELNIPGSSLSTRHDKFWKFVLSNCVPMTEAAAIYHIMEGQWAEAKALLSKILPETVVE